MNNKSHYWAAVVAYVIWGFFPITLRVIKEYSAGEILYFRILFSLLILLFLIVGFRWDAARKDWLVFKSLSRLDRNRTIMLTIAGGVLLNFNWLIFIYTVNEINLKTASFSYFICPVITAVLGYLLLKERLSTLQWVAVSLCALSCILMGISSVQELGYSFFTAVSYALYLISQRRNQGFDRLVSLGIQVLCACILLNVIFSYLVDEVPTAINFYGIIMIIAVVFTVIPLFLSLYALNRINSATAGVLMYLNPIINFIVAFVVLRESVNFIQVLGYSIIAVALVIFNYQNFRKFSSVLR